jgi:hypothetical protein
VNYDSIRQSLVAELQESSKAKSSHWQFHTESLVLSSDFRISGINGFSNRTRRFPGSYAVHKRNLKKLFPWARRLIESTSFSVAKDICHTQRREVDSCVMRHVFTFELLEKYSEITFRNVCVIGDGQANFISLALTNGFSEKLISVNLTEVLLSDLDLIEKLNVLKVEDVSVGKNFDDVQVFLNDDSKKLLLISAHNAAALFNAGINLFVNIASFQEMNQELIDYYFKIVKSNSAYLYCCNRLEKQLYGGELNLFSNYPWGREAKILLDEACKWHQEFYSLRSPLLYKKLPFDGKIWHRLVKY